MVVHLGGAVDHVALLARIRAHPEQLLDYLDEHGADDELQGFLRAYWDFLRNDPAWGK